MTAVSFIRNIITLVGVATIAGTSFAQSLTTTNLIFSIDGDELGIVPIALDSSETYPVSYALNSGDVSFLTADAFTFSGAYTDPLFCFDFSQSGSSNVTLSVKDANRHDIIKGLGVSTPLQYGLANGEIRFTPSADSACFYRGVNSESFGLFGVEPLRSATDEVADAIFIDSFVRKEMRLEFSSVDEFVSQGESFNYKLTVENISADTLSNIGLQELFPANTDFFDAALSETQWTCLDQDEQSCGISSVNSDGSLRFEDLALAPGDSLTLDISRRVDAISQVGSVIKLHAGAVAGSKLQAYDAAQASVTVVGAGDSLVATSSNDNVVDEPLSITVTALDGNTNPVPSLEVSLVSDEGMGVTPAVATTDGFGEAEFTAATTAAGTYTVSFSADNVPDAVVDVTVDSGPAASMNASVVENNIVANGQDVLEFEVELLDEFDNPVEAGSNTVDVVDDGGLTSIQPASQPVGTNGVATFSATSTSASSYMVEFSASDVASKTVTATFVAGAADAAQSMIEADPTTITTDQSSQITVRLEDQNGNPLDAGGDSVGLSTDQGSLTTVMDNNDGTYTATLTAATTGTATISGTLNGQGMTDTAVVTIDPGTADVGQSTINASPASIIAGGSSTITVQLNDQDGNPLTSSGGAVALSTDLGSVGAVTDNGDGSYTATFESTTAGTATITGTLDGATISDAASVDVSPDVADAGETTISADPSSITTDGSSTITVRIKDQYGNDRNFEIGNSISLTTDFGNLNNFTVNGDGTITQTLTASSPGTATITGTLNSDSIGDDATVTITAGEADPATTMISAAPATMTAGASSAIDVQLKDQYGNPLEGSGGTVALTADLGSVGAVTDNEDGSYTATFESTTSGTAAITGTVDGQSINDTATVQVNAGPADPTTSTLTASPDVITVGESTTVTVELKDQYGNSLTASGGSVVFNTDTGAISGGVTDVGDGSYTTTLTTSTTAGEATVSATLDGVGISDTATVTINPDAADASQSTITADPVTMTTDDSSAITIQLKDQHGNLLVAGGYPVTLDTSVGSVDATATDNGDGTYSATLVSTATGIATITGELDGVAMADDASVTIEPGAANAAQSMVTASPDTILNGETATITVQLKDANGNNLVTGGDTVFFALDSGPGSIGSVTDVGDGTYTTTYTSGGEGTTEVIAFVNGSEITDSALITITPP